MTADVEHIATDSSPQFDDYNKGIDYKELESTATDDFVSTCCEVRFVAPLLLLLAVFMSYQMAVAPYQVNLLSKSSVVLTDLVIVFDLNQ